MQGVQTEVGTATATDSLVKRFISPWQLAVCMAAALGLVALCWWLSGLYTDTQRQHHLAQSRLSAANEANLLASTLSSRLSQIQGLAESMALDPEVGVVLTRFGLDATPTKASPPERAAAWRANPALQPLASRLDALAHKLDLNALLVVNAAGDCIASGTLEGTQSMTGFHYSDRFYFQEARAGRSARQFVVGRASNLPMVIFSAPVLREGGFLGMAGAAIDISKLRAPQSESSILVTDEAGVVVQSSRQEWVMRTLPGAPVLCQSSATTEDCYKRSRFDPLSWQPGPWPQTVRVGDGTQPGGALLVWAQRPVQDGLLRVHVLEPFPWEANLQRDRLYWFAATSAAMVLLLCVAVGGALFVAVLRRQETDLLKLNQELVALARTDPLTGCANRRHFLETLELEQQRSRRSGHPYCLLSLDLDHFKAVNDQHGHAAGDEVLRAFTRTVQDHLRKTDALGRLGGEEFSVLLPDTAASEGALVAEKIRAHTELSQVLHDGQAIRWTVSVGGVQSQPEDGAPPAKWLEASDQALYQAKSQGRNRVVWAQTAPTFKA